MYAGVHEFENEQLTLYDFLSATLRRVHKTNVQEDMLSAFRLYDLDGNGNIDADELYFVMTKVLGMELSKREAKEMIRQADSDHNGQVSYEEFVKIVTNSL
jgi:Ca2+-binding EF-hand superfamily protein